MSEVERPPRCRAFSEVTLATCKGTGDAMDGLERELTSQMVDVKSVSDRLAASTGSSTAKLGGQEASQHGSPIERREGFCTQNAECHGPCRRFRPVSFLATWMDSDRTLAPPFRS